MFKKSLAVVLSLLMILSVAVALPASAESGSAACAHSYNAAGKCSVCGTYDWIVGAVESNPTCGASTVSSGCSVSTVTPAYSATTGKLEAPTGGAVTVIPNLVNGSDYSVLANAPVVISFDLAVNEVLVNNAAGTVPLPLLTVIGSAEYPILSLAAIDEKSNTVEVVFDKTGEQDRLPTSSYGWKDGIEFSSIYSMTLGEECRFVVLLDSAAGIASVYINGAFAGVCNVDNISQNMTAEYKVRFGRGSLTSPVIPYFFGYSLDNVSANVYGTIGDAYAALPVNQIFSLRYDRWQTGHTVSSNSYRPGHAKGAKTYVGSFENLFGATNNSYATAEDGSVYATVSNSTATRRISLSTTSNGNKFDLSGKKYEIRVNFALDSDSVGTTGDIVRLYRGSDIRWALVSFSASGTFEAHKKALYNKDGVALSFTTDVESGAPAKTYDLRVVVDEVKGTYSIYVDGALACWKNSNHFDPFIDMPLSGAKTFTDSVARDFDYLQLFAGSTAGMAATLKEVSVTLIRDDDIEFIGSQSRNSDKGAAQGTFDLRFAFGVDNIYVDKIGFRVNAYKNGESVGDAQFIPVSTVYKALNAAGGKLQAYRCPEGEYLAAFKIVGVEETDESDIYTFKITPYTESDDVKIYSEDTYRVYYNGIGQFVTEPENNMTDTTFVPTLRFVVTSDIHISTAAGKTAGHFASIMEQINAYVAEDAKNGGYGKLDAVVVAGDITGEGSDSAAEKATHAGGTREEFEIVKKIFDDTIPAGTELILTMGNHDYGNVAISGYTDEAIKELSASFRNDFEDVFDTKAAQMVNINGFYFVTVDVDAAEGKTGHEYSAASVATLEGHLKEATANAGSDMPIFVFQHVGNFGTILGTSTDAGASNYTTALYDVQKQYSNAIVFSGHTHVPINDECSIHQKDFTSINTGALSGITRAKANGTNITMDNIKYPQAAYLVEADAYGRVRVRMWSAMDGGFYGDTWMIDSYDKDEFEYTEDRFSDEDIFFAEGAAVTVTNVTETSITVKVPHVPAESLSARAYEFVVTDAKGNVVKKVYRSLAYYKDDFNQVASVTIDGLTAGTEYTVSVRAANPLYNYNVTADSTLFSAPLTKTFTTAGSATTPETPETPSDPTPVDLPEIVGFTVGANGITASTGSLLTPTGTPVVKENALSFNGTAENLVYFNYTGNVSALQGAFTLETYIRVDELPDVGKTASLVGSMHNGNGFRLEIANTTQEGSYFAFSIYPTEGDMVMFTKSCVKGTYYHVVVTFDGTSLMMYVDGEAVAAKPAAFSGLKLHSLSGYHKIYLGADVNKDGKDEAYSNCSIAHFAMFSGAMTATEVAARAATFSAQQ